MSDQIQSLDFSVDVLRALLWQYNDAARLEGLLRQKQAWYDGNQKSFWENWITDVFDLRTANAFGCAVWAIILDIPLSVTSEDDPDKPTWGFDIYRENFTNGNFSSTQASGLSLDQKRTILRLRYFQLVSKGAVPEINKFLKYLFGNQGGPALAPGLYSQYTVADVARCFRDSPAYYMGPEGTLIEAKANEVRTQYDPETGAALGVLVEAEATNLLSHSSAFDNAAWVKLGATVTPNAAIAPDGSLTADKVTNSAGVVSLLWQVAPVTPSATNDYYPSIFVEKGAVSSVTLNAYYTGNAEDNVTFDLDTLTASGAPYAGEYLLEEMPGGWFRVGYRMTRDASGARASIQNRFWINSRGTGTAGESLNVWGSQLEPGAAPSSYIPTTTAPATRAADEIHISDPATPGNAYVVDGRDMTARYVFEFPLPSGLEMIFTEYDLLPRPAGVKIDYVIIGDADGWGFGRYHENFTNGNFDHA